MSFKRLLAASLATGVLAAAAAAAAAPPQTLDVTSIAMNDPVYITFSNASTPDVINETVADAPLTLTLESGKTLLAFCVDIYHNIIPGSVQTNYSQPALAYQLGSLTNDSSGTTTGTGSTLTSTQIGEIGGLANLGFTLYRANTDPNLSIDLAAIQASIWAIENPSIAIAAAAPTGPGGAPLMDQNTSDVTAELDSQISYYENTYAPENQSTANVSTYYDAGDNTQGVIVTEPGTWALMLVGIGGLGAVVRGRRGVSAKA
jgi:hypothetical protein